MSQTVIMQWWSLDTGPQPLLRRLVAPRLQIKIHLYLLQLHIFRMNIFTNEKIIQVSRFQEEIIKILDLDGLVN